MWVMIQRAVSDFNPRPPRGGRLYINSMLYYSYSISIHAPREGGDGVTTSTAMVQEISIHAPREGGDCRMTCLPLTTV